VRNLTWGVAVALSFNSKRFRSASVALGDCGVSFGQLTHVSHHGIKGEDVCDLMVTAIEHRFGCQSAWKLDPDRRAKASYVAEKPK
jgi:hypothetical protein